MLQGLIFLFSKQSIFYLFIIFFCPTAACSWNEDENLGEVLVKIYFVNLKGLKERSFIWLTKMSLLSCQQAFSQCFSMSFYTFSLFMSLG